MERLTEKHYLGTDHYMKCSVILWNTGELLR